MDEKVKTLEEIDALWKNLLAEIGVRVLNKTILDSEILQIVQKAAEVRKEALDLQNPASKDKSE